MSLYQIPQPSRQQLDQGATRQQTYIFPPNQPGVWNFGKYVPVEEYAEIGDLNAVAPFTGSFVFQPNQPEMSYWQRDAGMRSKTPIGSAVLPIQGATILRTDPIPPVGFADQARYAAQHALRYVVDARPQVDQGATKQRTDPIPPTKQPEFSCYKPDANRYATGPQSPLNQPVTAPFTNVFKQDQPTAHHYLPDVNRYEDANDLGRIEQLDGATRQRTDPIPPVSQPEMRGYALRDALRFVVGSILPIQGATVQQTHPTPPVTTNPSAKYHVPDVNRHVDANDLGRMAQLDGATTQPWFIYPTSQPEMTAYERARQVLRYIVDAKPRFEGATTMRTDPIPPVSQPEQNAYDRTRNALRYVVDAKQQIDQGATKQQTYIFPPNEPDMARFSLRDALRYVVDPVKRLETIVPLNQATFLFPVSQPELSWWVPLTSAWRFMLGARPQVDQGASSQQTYVFYPNQPEITRVEALRQMLRHIVPATPRLEGATTQQTYVFQPGQPDASRVEGERQKQRYVVDAPKRLDGPTVQATFIFPPNQPEITRAEAWRQLNRYVVDAKAQIDAGATIQATYIFPPNQPELNRFSAVAQALRYVVGAAPRFDGATKQQTYIFAPSQPRAERETRPIVSPYFPNPGIVTPQTYLFPVSQPRVEPTRQTPVPPIDSSLLGITRRVFQRGYTVLTSAAQKAVLKLGGQANPSELSTGDRKTSLTTRNSKTPMSSKDNTTTL